MMLSLFQLRVGVEKSLSLFTEEVSCNPGSHGSGTELTVVYMRSKWLKVHTVGHRIASLYFSL